jgi:hypothetical protein
VRSGALGHVVVSDPSEVEVRSLELWDMWQRRTAPRRRCGVWSLGTHGSVGPLLGRGVESGALGHMTALEPSLSREAGSGAAMARGSAWVHALPFVFAISMYVGVPSL